MQDLFSTHFIVSESEITYLIKNFPHNRREIINKIFHGKYNPCFKHQLKGSYTVVCRCQKVKVNFDPGCKVITLEGISIRFCNAISTPTL